MATSNGSTAIRDKILASLARYRALRIGKFPCAFWRLSSRPGLTANGKEFAGHEKLAEQLETKVYFAHPYASWERGLNESTNGLIRQYFVKGSSFEEISGEEVEAVMNKLNHRCQPWRANARAGSPQKA